MNPLKYLGVIILILALVMYPAQAATNTTCGTANQSVSGNITANYTINGTLFCNQTAGDWFNLTAVTTDTNITKLFNFTGSNWSMGIRLIINNTDNSTNYSVRIYNGTNTTGNVSHNVTVKSNATGWIQFNMTGFNNTGWINVSIVNGGSNAIPASYVYSAAFAVIVGAGAAIYLRRTKKV